MWLDELEPGTSWYAALWQNVLACGTCSALICETPKRCPVCGRTIDAVLEEMAAGRIDFGWATTNSWSDHAIVKLTQQEWERPLPEDDTFEEFPDEHRPSQRAIVVILFWTLFESLMGAFFARALRNLPTGVVNDLKQRHRSIESRLARFSKVLFSTTFQADLEALGYGYIHGHLRLVQLRRNEFVHGKPEAIDDGLVAAVVERLYDVHRMWMSLYNRRCTTPPVGGG